MQYEIMDLARQVHNENRAKGFWPDGGRNMTEAIMLIVSEAGECLEAHRKGRSAPHVITGLFSETVKDTYQDELADICIRCLDLIGYYNEDPIPFNATVICTGNFGEDLFHLCRPLLMFNHVSTGSILVNVLEHAYSMAAHYGIDLDSHIQMKLEYNRSRPHKHGKNY